jgi:hypothetical protein
MRYVLPVREGLVSIGHGMCSGPFEFKPGTRYSATFWAVDLAGNEPPAPGMPVEFEGPPRDIP